MIETFHLLAYNSALVTTSTDAQIAAIAEQQFNRSNSSFQIPVDMMIHLAYGQGVNMSRLRINQGSLLPKGLPQIFPVGVAATPPAVLPLCDWRDTPLPIRREEDLRLDATHTDAATQNMTAGIWLSDKPLSYNISDRGLRWIRFTATPTNVAFAWSTPVSLTPQDTLEGGKYNVYGMDSQGATSMFARLVFQGQWCRPGVVCRNTLNDYGTNIFKGGMGLFGSFNTYSYPQLEIFGSNAGATAQDVKLLVAKAA